MPYVINRPPAKGASGLIKRAVVGVVAIAAVGFSAAPAMADVTPSCSAPSLTQPFLNWGDDGLYALAPGESPDSLDGTGWTLSGGASIVQTQLQDGTTGNVLDMPSGSSAVSPVMCVDTTYTMARTMVDNAGGKGWVHFSVSYMDPSTGLWSTPDETSTEHVHNGETWKLSHPLNLEPAARPGWQLVEFTFTTDGPASEPQLYNFYVDPYAKG
jgi:hypothetical protein